MPAQVVLNLTHNALRYTKRGGILIGLRVVQGAWRIEVWDTGVGIATEDRDRIFSPFYRNQQAWQIDSAGHGLGLAVVARCARLLKATIGFQSRLGSGSRFWIDLAAVSSSNAAQREPFWLSPAQPALTRLAGRCLVVDDDPLVLAAWRDLLPAWGIEGRYAANGGEAFGLLDDGFVPDAVLCDQRLRSGESGLEVLEALLSRCPQASGAMLSGEFNSPELIRAESDGYIVLRKPLDPGQLHTVLSQWLARDPQSDRSPENRAPLQSAMPSTPPAERMVDLQDEGCSA